MSTWPMTTRDDDRNARNARALLKVAQYLKTKRPDYGEYRGPKTFFDYRPRSVDEMLDHVKTLPLDSNGKAVWVKRWLDHAVASFGESCLTAAGATAAANGADASHDVILKGEPVDLKITSLPRSVIDGLTEEDLVRKLLGGVMDPTREEHQHKVYVVVAREAGVTTAEAKSSLPAIKAAVGQLVKDWHQLQRVPLHAKEFWWFGVVVVVDAEGERIHLAPEWIKF